MRAGEFNRRVTIQTVTEAADGEGGGDYSFADAGRVWAKVASLTARATTERRMIGDETTQTVTIRRGPLVPTVRGHRLMIGATPFRIEAIRDADDRQTMELDVSPWVGG